MTKSMPMIEARNKLTRLPEEFEQSRQSGAVAVTRRGKPVLAVLPWDLYESLIETLEILGDEQMMAEFRQGVKEIAAGKLVRWEKTRKELLRDL
jgi:antitoxin YefM